VSAVPHLDGLERSSLLYLRRHFDMIEEHDETGSPDGARRILERAFEQCPGNVGMRFNLACLELRDDPRFEEVLR
jgi:Tetratricopeptide repeat